MVPWLFVSFAIHVHLLVSSSFAFAVHFALFFSVMLSKIMCDTVIAYLNHGTVQFVTYNSGIKDWKKIFALGEFYGELDV